jgi:hypothetical protein
MRRCRFAAGTLAATHDQRVKSGIPSGWCNHRDEILVALGHPSDRAGVDSRDEGIEIAKRDIVHFRSGLVRECEVSSVVEDGSFFRSNSLRRRHEQLPWLPGVRCTDCPLDHCDEAVGGETIRECDGDGRRRTGERPHDSASLSTFRCRAEGDRVERDRISATRQAETQQAVVVLQQVHWSAGSGARPQRAVLR